MNVLFGESEPRLLELFGDPSSTPQLGESWTVLPPVYSGGSASKPRLALVFVNPTYRNQSARESWQTGRAPFIGLRRIWEFLASCRLIDAAATERLPADGEWTPADAAILYEAVAAAGLYVTNLVKACRQDSVMPTVREARLWLPLLERELDVVQPEVVVGMGTLVSSLILREQVKMRNYFELVARTSVPPVLQLPGRGFGVVPCYFPVGRGNPAKARIILEGLSDPNARRSVA